MNRFATTLLPALAVLVAGTASTRADDASAASDRVRIDGNRVTAGRQTVVLADTGLPDQILLRPGRDELPLELRIEGGEPTAEQLQFIGRGRRLRGAIRIEAVVKGSPVAARLVEPARARMQGGHATARSRLRVGPYEVRLACTYRPDGEFLVDIDVSGGGEDDQLRMVIEPVQPADLVCLNLPDGPPGTVPLEKLDAFLPQTEGVVWNSAEQTADGRVPQLYVGSADAGLTWLCFEAPKLPSDVSQIILARDEVGRATWQMTLLAGPGGRARFALRIHPVRSRPLTARREAWLRWPGALEPVAKKVAGPVLFRREGGGEVRKTPAAPAAAPPGYLALAPYAQYGELRGAACAELLSREKNAVTLYPMSLYRALAGGPSGLVMRVRPNVRELFREYEPALDRQVFGRALLHDVGVAMEGVAQPAELFQVTRALRKFGYFEADGLTEYIPYWRVDGIARYGEAFDPSGAFNLTTEDPSGSTYVSVYRRPYEAQGKKGVQAMFVVVNERDKSVRHRLYVLDVARIFGQGRNRPVGRSFIAALEYGSVPGDSDWGKERIPRRPEYRPCGLRDLEDGGFVLAPSNKGQTAEIYGPLFVPAHDFRLVWAYGLPADDADRSGGTRRRTAE